jgi:hypothetical protein
MEFSLEPESTESLQAALAFIDDTLGATSPSSSQECNAELQSSDWETSHLLDEFMTNISSASSSPRLAADLTMVGG